LENAPAQRIGENTVESQKDIDLLARVVQVQVIKSLNNLLTFHPPFFIAMKKELTFYYHPDCDNCSDLKPIFKKVAKLNGLKFKEVNIENCDTKICQDIGYVPTIFVDGRKLSIEEMEKLF